MHKTTIMLPMKLKVLAEQEAHRRGISLGEMIRIALKQAMQSSKKKKSQDSLFDFDVVYTGPCKKDVSIHHNKYLYGEQKKK